MLTLPSYQGLPGCLLQSEVVATEHLALALILLPPRAGTLSKSPIKSLKSCSSQFYCQHILSSSAMMSIPVT